MATITDKAMQAKASTTDTWLTHSLKRGAGALVGRITPSAERLFYFRYTDSQGRRPLLPIGPYHPKGAGGLTLAQAFDRAAELSAMYRAGVRDLREHFERKAAERQRAEEAERRAREDADRAAALAQARRLTVRQVFDRWRETDLQPVIRADGRRDGRKDGGLFVFEQFTRHVFPLIGDMALEDVRKSDLLAVIDKQKSAGKLRTAQQLLGDLKQMLHFSLDRELVQVDPLATVKKSRIVGAPTKRKRYLSEDEIRLLPQAIEAGRMAVRSAAALWLILATGVRNGEAMGAVWASDLPKELRARQIRLDALRKQAEAENVKLGMVDVEARTWYLPDTKNQRDHNIHLSDFAIGVLGQLQQYREVLTKPAMPGELSPWVFPATDNARPVCVKSLGKQIGDRQREPEERLSRRTKSTTALVMPGGRWTAHDLRRTTATLMARLGFFRDVVNEALNHMQQDEMALIYIHDRYEAQQARAFDAVGKRLQELATDTGTPSVAPPPVLVA